MKIIILNLPRDLSEDGLADLFRAHGGVDSCDLVMDANTGISKGFGFVEMPAEEEAEAAIAALHGTKINKSKIRVKPAT
jgi:RNA recognition motif-containing protein